MHFVKLYVDAWGVEMWENDTAISSPFDAHCFLKYYLSKFFFNIQYFFSNISIHHLKFGRKENIKVCVFEMEEKRTSYD